MARPLRIEFPGALYHVTSRGNASQAIFIGNHYNLFQRRYKAILVEKENHLLSLCRSVVLNPFRVGLIKRPEDYATISRAIKRVKRG